MGVKKNISKYQCSVQQRVIYCIGVKEFPPESFGKGQPVVQENAEGHQPLRTGASYLWPIGTLTRPVCFYQTKQSLS